MKVRERITEEAHFAAVVQAQTVAFKNDIRKSGSVDFHAGQAERSYGWLRVPVKSSVEANTTLSIVADIRSYFGVCS